MRRKLEYFRPGRFESRLRGVAFSQDQEFKFPLRFNFMICEECESLFQIFEEKAWKDCFPRTHIDFAFVTMTHHELIAGIQNAGTPLEVFLRREVDFHLVSSLVFLRIYFS